MNAAILFEPDGYLLTGPRLMGRQAAGNGFLRAAVHGRGGQVLSAFTPFRSSAEVFQQTVAEIDPAAQTQWIPARRLDLLSQIGVLYRPDQVLGPAARQRLRAGPAAYAICGVTHTLATHTTLDWIAKIPVEPMMPWDALICTSRAALDVVTTVLDYQDDHLRWLYGETPKVERPLLPIIPLGVHCADFDFTPDERTAARERLGLGAETVAFLFAGRLSMNGKAHPYAMLAALQQVAEATGRDLALVFAGQAFNESIDRVFKTSIAALCPSVRVVFVDGKDTAFYRQAWAGTDVFVSLADSIQETFGLTPLEAMAAGLPALVSDWNGYRDTVRDGVDGFRISTWTPPPGAGGRIAHNYESGAQSYDEYLGHANTAVTVDMTELVARMTDLATDGDLRRRLGAAGQTRARESFDWAVVYRSYQLLWDQQRAMLGRAKSDPKTAAWLARAPKAGPEHMGPFDTFAAYPTHHVGPATRVRRDPTITLEAYRERLKLPLLAFSAVSVEVVERVFAAVDAGAGTIGEVAEAAGLTLPQMTEAAARLAKTGLLALSVD